MNEENHPDHGDKLQSENRLRTFDTDNGELDGLTPQECFVLGFEACTIEEALKRGKGFRTDVNSANKDRIAKACMDAGREFKMTWIDDSSEAWMRLKVKRK